MNPKKITDFRKRLEQLPRDELLEIIRQQDPEYIKQINRIEWVFANKLRHLTWEDGTPIEGRPLTNEELSYIVDVPFEFDESLLNIGLDAEKQRELHIASDPVTWAKTYLSKTDKAVRPRVYQIIMMRHPKRFKVFRMGRRSGKTFTMAILLLHYSYITNKGRSLVVTPMKEQAGLIYKEMLELAEETVVEGSISRNITAPQHEIDFTNGSTVKFFTSGMKTGSKSDITRGQEAHFIVLDEMDYMGDDDLEALLAMIQKTAENQVDKRMFGASTPSGRRESSFYKWCHSKRFKEFWYPSYCNPLFDKESEDFFREEYTEMGFRHEIEADWGELSEGVYPKRYVDMAFQDPGWEYLAAPQSQNGFYVMGVDWDKHGAGVNIVIVQVCDHTHEDPKYRNKVKLVYREETIREEYTFLNAVDRVIELDQRFNPRHIYIDMGSGEVQWEMLRKYGVNHPQSGITRKLKGINFGSSIEIRDPFTMQKNKKEIKPFMVDVLRKMLEVNSILMPAEDYHLYMQLISYVVIRETYNGRPIFEMVSEKIPDHAHDALILATLAIEENYGELMKTNYARQSKVVSQEAFLPLFHLSQDPNVREGEEEVIKEIWGKKSSAPIMNRRPLACNVTGRSRPIRRKTF